MTNKYASMISGPPLRPRPTDDSDAPSRQSHLQPSPQTIHSREALAIEVGQRLRGEHVVDVLNHLVRQRGALRYLFADNGSEFTGRLVDL